MITVAVVAILAAVAYPSYARHIARGKRNAAQAVMQVVMVVAAIMLGIGIPSFRQFTATQRVKGAAFDFAGALLLARSEAIKRNAAVTVDQAVGGWAGGWSVNAAGNLLSTQQAAA